MVGRRTWDESQAGRRPEEAVVGRTRLGGLLLLVAALVVAPATAHGEVVAGVTSSATPEVVVFDTAAPGKILWRAPVTGLAFGERVWGLDLRPADGQS